MKYPEYDSPFELVMSDITTKIAGNIDDMCWQAVQRVGVNVDKDKLILALELDSDRYRKAFRRGEETGYTKRNDEIIRCKDCENYLTENEWCKRLMLFTNTDWFCADGERKSE